jgi:predicted transcriptional regulator
MNRSNEDIIADILRVCRSPNDINRIMSDANINFSQSKIFVPWLNNRGFLSSSDGDTQKKIYSTTEKGTVLLLAIENVQIMLGKKKVPELVCRQTGSKLYI